MKIFSSRNWYLLCICLILIIILVFIKFVIASVLLFSLILLGIIIGLIFFVRLLIDSDNKKSINKVPKYYLKGRNVISNTRCTVKYFLDDKIIVVDNVPDTRNKKRMFTLILKDKYVLNKRWADICRDFGDKTSVETLSKFLKIKEENVILIDAGERNTEVQKSKFYPNKMEKNKVQTNLEPEFVDINSVSPDIFGVVQEKKSANKEGEFINLDTLLVSGQFSSSLEEDTSELVDFSDTFRVDSKKILVNQVTAAEMSVLPYINIEKAKKIVEYRDKNGYFKNSEDFFKVAELEGKEAIKIKPLIDLEVKNQEKP